MTDHAEYQDIHELLVPFALGELSDVEHRRVQRALDDSSSLRAELAAIEETNARLIMGSVAHMPAPAALRGRVLDAIGAAEHRTTEPARTTPAAAKAARRWSMPRFAMPALVGGLAVACVTLAIVAMSIDGDLDDANQRIDSLKTGPATSDPGEKTSFAVSTHGNMGPASGQLVRVGGDRWVLLMTNVPDPGAGNSWQVWTADTQGNIRNIGQWVAGAASQALLVDEANVRQVMVSLETTEEPVETPGSEPVMSVKV